MAYTTETKLSVRYSETDMMGIVYHSRYYPWFEVARTDFIKAAGILSMLIGFAQLLITYALISELSFNTSISSVVTI